ncbi:hypothetical protein FPV67DRAFT_837788 [Lyophyllum atratum]|nr:hypothetical protein FPV67DRAFT_837788 [Lyophyllum atratum]
MPSVSQTSAVMSVPYEAPVLQMGMQKGWPERVAKSSLVRNTKSLTPSRVQRARVSIRALSTEILLEIFSLCAGRKISQPLRHRAPYIFLGVCSHWRAIAQNNPRLWTFLTFDWKLDCRGRAAGNRLWERGHGDVGLKLPHNGPAPFDGMMAIQSWIGLARGRPLTLVLNMPPTPSTNSFSSVIQRSGPHTRNLSLSAPLSLHHKLTKMISTSASCRGARFPMLEVLHLSMPYEKSDRAFTRRLTSTRNISLRDCRKLREVYLDSADSTFGFIADNILSDIPYEQLTDLSLVDVALHPLRARGLLMRCTSLVKCHLKVAQWNADDYIPASPQPVTLARLQVLIAEFSGSSPAGQIAPFFDTLTLPLLTKFTIAASHSFDANLIPVLVRMQTRSRAPIRKLAFMGVPLPYETVPIFLRMLPQLASLRIEAPIDGRCYSYTNILTSIRYRRDFAAPGVENVLPSLEEIYIADNLHSGYSDMRTGRLARDYVGRRVDISRVLKDYEVLDAIESRCWAHGETPDPRDNGNVDSLPLKSLEVATVEWRNVPLEWRDGERRGLDRKEEMEEVYSVGIYLPLGQ